MPHIPHQSLLCKCVFQTAGVHGGVVCLPPNSHYPQGGSTLLLFSDSEHSIQRELVKRNRVDYITLFGACLSVLLTPRFSKVSQNFLARQSTSLHMASVNL